MIWFPFAVETSGKYSELITLTISHYQKVKGRSHSSGHCGIPLVAGWRPEPVINAKGQSRQSNQYSLVPRLITARLIICSCKSPLKGRGREWRAGDLVTWHMLALGNCEECETAGLLLGGVWGNRNTCNDFNYQYFCLSENKSASHFY